MRGDTIAPIPKFLQVYGTGTVAAILSDDLEDSRHQRFIIELKIKANSADFT